MNVLTGKVRLGLALVLGIAGTVVFLTIPPSTQTIVLPTTAQDATQIESFSDASHGGGSSLHMQIRDSGITLQVVLDSNKSKDAWAGVGWNVQKRNWSFADTLYFDVRTQGTQKLLIKVLTMDPDHSVKGEKETYRQLEKDFVASSKWTRVAIPAEHLYIPDWWYDQRKVPREHDNKHLEDVRRLDLLFPPESPRGVPLELEIRSVTLFGGTSKNLAYFAGYIFLLLLLVVGRNPNKRVTEK